MSQNGFKNFATFESLITPKIITVVYWLTTILLIIGSVVGWVQGSGGVNIGFSLSLILVRVLFELIMVSFKNNEYLRKICEAVSKDKGEPDEPVKEWKDIREGESADSLWKKQP